MIFEGSYFPQISFLVKMPGLLGVVDMKNEIETGFMETIVQISKIEDRSVESSPTFRNLILVENCNSSN